MAVVFWTTDVAGDVDSLMFLGDPTEKETEQITQLWQSSLFNAHYDVQRLVHMQQILLFVHRYV